MGRHKRYSVNEHNSISLSFSFSTYISHCIICKQNLIFLLYGVLLIQTNIIIKYTNIIINVPLNIPEGARAQIQTLGTGKSTGPNLSFFFTEIFITSGKSCLSRTRQPNRSGKLPSFQFVEGYRFLSWLLQSIGQAFTRTTFKLLSDDLWKFISVTAFSKAIQSWTAAINQ